MGRLTAVHRRYQTVPRQRRKEISLRFQLANKSSKTDQPTNCMDDIMQYILETYNCMSLYTPSDGAASAGILDD